MFMFVWLFKRTKIVSFKKYIWNYLSQGFVNFTNGLFIVYTSDVTRTPPIVFLVLGNTGIIYGIFLTRFILKKKINYKNLSPIISLIFLGTSVIIMIIGEMIYDSNLEQFNYYMILFICLNLLGVFSASCYNVLQEKYLTISNVDLDTKEEKNVNLLITLFWTSLFQFIFVALAWPVDIIPVFGYSTWSTFWTNFYQSILCFFGQEHCGCAPGLFGTAFVVGYVITYLSTIVLNKESANFAIYASAINSPLTALIFIITGYGTEATPLWAVIPSMILVVIGIIVWKRWENKILHPSEDQIHPPEDQIHPPEDQPEGVIINGI
jgi:hypothetical protein